MNSRAADIAVRDALSALLAEVDAGVDSLNGWSALSAAANAGREALAGSRRHEFFVVITQRDGDKEYNERHPDRDDGPIVWECTVNGATQPQAQAHAKKLADKYGWTRVGRVIVEDWPGESA